MQFLQNILEPLTLLNKPVIKINFWCQFFIYDLVKRKILFSYVITFPAVRLWLEYSFNLELNVVYIIRLLLFGSRLLKKVTRYASFVYFITKIWFDSPFITYARYRCYVVRHYSDMSVSFTCAVCIPMSIAFNSSSSVLSAFNWNSSGLSCLLSICLIFLYISHWFFQLWHLILMCLNQCK